MSKILVLFLLSLAVAVKASHSASALYLKLADHSPFTVIFDHKAYRLAATDFYLPLVAPGDHLLQVLGANSNPFASAPVLYHGMIHIPANTNLHTLIDLNQNLRIITAIPGNACAMDPCGYAPFPPPVYLSPNDLHYLKTAMMKEPFDSARLELAIQAIATCYVRSEQVRVLLDLFTFDTSKLELARYAYPHTSDKHNYHLLNGAFDFESSIRFLKDFIRSY